MAETTDFVDILSEQVTSGIDQAQELNLATLEVARAFAALFEPLMPLDLRPKASGYLIPKAAPGATSVIDEVYSLAGKVLDLQHDHLVRVAESMTLPAPAEKS